uniref:Putative secreted protein n=1 Tax=Anopheles triannulatus TaxID=58253 RepID=A0A2M4B3W2_9DIPT
MYFMLVFVFKFTFVSHAQTPVLRREGIRGKNDGQGESVSTLQTYARSLTIPTVAPNPLHILFYSFVVLCFDIDTLCT